ncbi:Down syndrome cell adhesion molecule-like protein Dscam2 [Nymphon striatum]|nr:Down syndrome cell adhesion molecule-like protein Dscam2 [Nymphon striatum]
MLSEQGAGLHITKLSSSIPPKIIDILSNVYTTVGEVIVLPCVAQAFPYSTYSWCKQNLKTGKCDTLTEGNGDSERIRIKDGYIIMKTDASDSGSYKCKISNEMGQEEAVTKLFVFSPISVFIHPQSQKVDIGQSVTLDCVVSGGPISFIEWTKNGEILRQEQEKISKKNLKYHIESVSTSSDGMYQCFVGNQFGRKQASSQLLLSAVPPVLTQMFDSKLIRPGSPLSLKCEAKGDPLPEISWQLRHTVLKNTQGTIIESKIGYNGIIISKLSKSNVNRFDGGIYSCIAKNKAGSDILDLLLDGTILIERNHIQLKSNGSIIVSNAVKNRDEGRYTCEAEDGQRSTSSAIGVITIIEKPTIDSWPEEKILNSRRRLHLSCSINEGDPPIDFSWTFNGKPVPHELQTIESDSAYSSVLTATNIGRAHSGKYSCIAQNKAGRTSESIQVQSDGSLTIHEVLREDFESVLYCEISNGIAPELSAQVNISSNTVRDKNGIRLYGMALLYVIPTMTAAIVLLITSIISTVIDTDTIRSRTSTKSYDKQDYMNKYGNNSEDFQLSSMSNKYDTGRRSNRLSSKDYHIYSDMMSQSSTLNHPKGTLEIQPYAEFTEDDPLKLSANCCWANNSGTGPVFILEPPNYVIFSNSRGAVINCLVHGDPDPSVTWITSTGDELKNIQNFLKILRNNSLEFLTFSSGNFQQNVHSNEYRCKASNKYGTVVSSLVDVKAFVDQQYSTQVYDEYVIEGNTAVFKCHIPSYIKDYVEVNAWIRNDQFRIPKKYVKGSRYYITEVGNLHVSEVDRVTDSKSTYKCETKHKASGKTMLSEKGAGLHITRLSSSIPPKIIDILSNVYTTAGETVVLPCVAQAFPYSTYRANGHSISGEGLETTGLPPLKHNDEYSSKCPNGQQATGIHKISSWCKQNQETGKCPKLTEGKSNGERISLKDGYLIMKTDSGDTGSYKCTLTNEMGQEEAVTKLHVFCEILRREQDNISKNSTKYHIESVSTSSDGMYQCFVGNQFGRKQASSQLLLSDGRVLIERNDRQLKSNGSIIISNAVKHRDEGRYICEAEDGQRSTSSGIGVITIIEKPTLDSWNEEKILNSRGRLHLLCSIHEGDPPIDFSWTFNGKPVPHELQTIESDSAYSSALTASNIGRAHSGKYSCIAQNKAGRTSESIQVLVRAPISVYIHPQGQKVDIGQSVTLDCVISGGPISFIEWTKNGEILRREQDNISKNSTEQINSDHGSSFTLKCEAKGDPLPEISWQLRNTVLKNAQGTIIESKIGYNGIIISKLSKSNVNRFDGGIYSCTAKNKAGNGRILIERNNRQLKSNGSIIISNAVKHRDEGRYICEAENGQRSTSSGFGVITIIASPEWEHKPKAVVATLQENVLLPCSGKGYPKNDFFLVQSCCILIDGKKKKLTNNSRIMLASDGSLTIQGVLKEDFASILYCEISNGIAPDLSAEVNISSNTVTDTDTIRSRTSTKSYDKQDYMNKYGNNSEDFQLSSMSNKYDTGRRSNRLSSRDYHIYSDMMSESSTLNHPKETLEIQPYAEFTADDPVSKRFDYHDAPKQRSILVSVITFFTLSFMVLIGSWGKNSGTGPVFILEPLNYVTFLNSRGAVINCLVHGDPDPRVTWITSTGDELRNIPNFLTVLKNNSLKFLTFSSGNFQQNVHSNEYRCKASNRYGTIVSNRVQVKALVDQHYSIQVYDEYVIEGNTAVLKCHVPSYIKDFVEVNAWIRNDEFRILKEYKQESRYYITEVGNLHISNIDGGAGLHITTLSSSIPPKIVDILSNVYTSAGKVVVLPCVAQAFPHPMYSLKDGSLIIKTDVGDTGSYMCKISNEMGEENAITKLHVFSPISVFIHPQSQKVDISQSVTLECVVSGGPIAFIEWTKNGELLKQDQKVSNFKNSKKYHIDSVSTSSDGMYQCFVGNQFERKQASSQLILSAIPPDLTKTFDSVTIRPGTSMKLKCEAQGDPSPEIIWKLRDTVLRNIAGTRIQSEIGYQGRIISKLSKSNVDRFDGGLYSCVAKNKAGKTSYSSKINVYGPLHIIYLYLTLDFLTAGTIMMLNSLPSSKLAYGLCHSCPLVYLDILHLLLDGIKLEEGNHVQIIGNGSIIIKHALKHRDEGKYVCEAENNQGSISSGSGRITIIEKPKIDHWHEKKILNSRGRLHLSCSVHEGDPPIEFSWKFNGIIVPHELQVIESDSAYLSILSASNVERKHSGKYSCIAQNKAGKTSESILVQVRTSPEWKHKPKSISVSLGKNTLLPCSGKGYPQPISNWFRLTEMKKMEVKNNSRILIAINGSLMISKVSKEDIKCVWICEIRNGIAPNLNAQVNISSNFRKGNEIKFVHVQNTYQKNHGDTVRMKCKVRYFGQANIQWLHSSRLISLSNAKRIKISISNLTNVYDSILRIEDLRETDSGLYTCRASAGKFNNVTTIYLSVQGKSTKKGSSIYTNKNMIENSGSGRKNTSITHEDDVGSNGFKLYGMALLYIIPTTTAALVLLVILTIVCILLQKQRKRKRKHLQSNTDTMRSCSSTKSYDKQVYMEKYGRNSESIRKFSNSQDNDYRLSVECQINLIQEEDQTDHLAEITTYMLIWIHSHPRQVIRKVSFLFTKISYNQFANIQPYAEFNADRPVKYSPANSLPIFSVRCSGTICEISGTGPVFILEPPNSVTFLNSHGAIINCLVHGDPDPKVTWITEANLKITSENTEILKNNSLVFLPFQIRSYNQNNHHVGYRCKASNKYGTIVSNIVKVKALIILCLYVLQFTDNFKDLVDIKSLACSVQHLKKFVDQQYSTQVYDEYIIEGNTAVFKCHVPSYVKDFVDVTAWIRDDDLRITKSFENGSRYYITDNGNIHITKVNDQLDSGSTYKCETKHQISGKTTISEHGAKLHITELSSSIPPKIVDISTNVEVMEGETVILPCVSQAYPQPSYRWCKRQRKDNSCQNIDLNKQNMWKIIDDGSLLIQGRKNDSGTYICRASNELGQEEAVTKLTVFSPMSVFIHPQTQLVDIGDEAVLKISSVDVSSVGMYQCFVGNRIERKQASAQISLSAIPPKLKKKFHAQRVKPGALVTLQCKASGDPLPEIVWKIRDMIVNKTERIKIDIVLKNKDVLSTLSISEVKTLDGGLYTCEAVNKIAKLSHSNLIQVYGQPFVWPVANKTAVTGDVDGKLLKTNRKLKIHENGSLVIFSANKQADDGEYKCEAESVDGLSAAAKGNINILQKPAIVPLLPTFIMNVKDRLHLMCAVLQGSPVWNKRPKSKYIVTASTTIEIPCSGNGYPEPKSSWSTTNGEKINNLQESSRIIITETGTLLIKQVLEMDYVTTFVCSVSNDFSPDLTQEASEEVVMRCQVDASGKTHINWQYGGKALIPSEDPRININNDDTTTGTISTLTIKETKLSDSGFYICKAHQRHLSNSTRFYLTVEGTVEDNKSNVFTNDSDGYYIKNESELSHENVTSSIFDNIQLYGVALLYIIPTVTAAIVLLVILIIVCVLLKGQRNKRHKSKMQDIEMKKSWRDHEQDFNTYGNRSNTSNKRRSLTKSSDTYYAMKQTKLQTDDNYHFYSEMPSASYHPDSSSITPYATFRSCTDPVPPIPNNAYPCTYCKISGTGPVFILEPQHTLTFLNHKGAIINCLVHGDPDPIVTWITGAGNRQADVPGFMRILRNNSLIFSPFKTGNYQQEIHANSFRCKATNKYGTIVSNLVNVKALVDQQYSTQVYDEYIIEGNTAVFKCHIPSYVKDFVEVNAWIRNDQLRITKSFQEGSRYYITGRGNLHVTKVNAQTDSDSVYKCETKHKISGKTTTSDHGARLHITELSSSIPPKIVDISASIDVSAGETSILPCKKKESRCQTIDVSKRTNWKIINEGSVLIVAQKNDSGTYMCSASNEMGQEDAVSKVTVFSPISVFIHPQTQMVDIGGSVKVECVVSGGPIQSIQWFKDGKIVNDYRNENFTKILKISPIDTTSVGMYQCFVKNHLEAKQASAQITLSAIPPKLTRVFQSLELKPGKSMTLHCSASGDPLPNILWKVRDSQVEQSTRIRIDSVENNGETSSTFSIPRIESSDGGLYTCEAINKIAEVIHSELIHVYGPLKVWPISNTTVVTGKKVELQCHVSGYPIQRLTWFKNGRQLKSNVKTKINQNGSLVIGTVDKQLNEGKYSCKVENNQGVSSSGSGFLKVIEKPTIVSVHPSMILKVGGRLHLPCIVFEGDPPIEFDWLFNGLPFPHSLDLTVADAGFSSTLTGDNLNRRHSGNYSYSPVWNEKPKAIYPLSILTNMEIPCSGNGYPKPKPFWSKVIVETLDRNSKQSILVNETNTAKEQLEKSKSQNVTSSTVKGNFQLYGIALFYIIPTITAAIVLIVILIIVCVLLHRQQRKRKKSRTQEMEMRKSWRYQEKDLNSYDYKMSDNRSSLSKSSEAYYEIKPNKRLSEDQYHFYSQMSSANPDSSSITPYATFRSCTDPVPPIPSRIYCKISGTGPVFILEPPHKLTFFNNKGASISCLVHGDPDPIVTWVTDTGSKQENVPGFLEILRNNSLVFVSFETGNYQQEIHATSFRCKATNRYGTIVSNRVNVKALVDQQYSTQVYDEYIIEGNTAVFKCHIPSYVKDFVEVSAWIRNDQLRINNNFDKASLSVFIHPQTQMVDIGDSVNIECVVSGGPIRSIQWFKDGMIFNEYINENFSKILNISPIDVKSVGMYQCFVENEVEAKQASAQITLSAIPTKFTKTFQSLLLKPGRTISLHCSASGDPLPKILWKLRDSVVEQSRKVRINSVEINHEISSTLSISEVESTDGGLYTCEAVNKDFESNPQRAHSSLWSSQSLASFKYYCHNRKESCVAMSRVWVSYSENHLVQKNISDGRKLKSNRRAEIKQNGSLIIDKVDKQSNQGRYKCKAENSQGLSSTGTGFLKVIEKPVVVLIPSIVLKVGGRLQIQCTVSEGDPPVTFSWLFNVLPLPHSLDLTIADAGFSSTLIGVNVNRNHFGNYTCQAKNEAGSDSKNTKVFVKDSPVWNDKPNTVYTLSQLTNIQIPCSGSGYPKPRSFWFKVKDDEISELEETSRIQITDSGSLIINKITEMDFGTKLLCSISNGISPDLQQEIQISKLRIEIKNDVNSTDSISTLIIKKVRVKDSGFYICKVQKDKISNSTRFYLSVEGGEGGGFKQGTFANRSKEAKEHVEHKQTKNFTSSSVKDNFQLYGVAMLYIIPTVTAAIVLLVILIIVCVLLHGQQQKRNKSRTQESLGKIKKKTLTVMNIEQSDKRSSLSKSSETYYEIKPNKRFSEDQYQFYSQMSSSTCNPDSSSITPYATFRSCTDPVPPIPGSTYPMAPDPVFILEPQHSLTFLNHKGAIINCLVHGDPDPIITWVENNGNKLENIPGYLKILRNNSLVFLPFITGNYRQEIHANSFRCKATNKFGTVVSNPVNVKALVDQHYSTQVYDEYIIEGNTAVFKCHIPSYVKDFVEIADITLRTMEICMLLMSKLNPIQIPMYKCETKHKISGKTTVSDHGARLHITELSGSIPPKIIDISSSIGVSAGKTVILPCVSQSNPSPSYRKEKDSSCKEIDVNKRKDWKFINEGSLLIVAQKNDSGTYICSASNEMGKEDAVTKVTVFSPISVFIHPQNQMADIGGSVSIECVVSGGPVKSMKWFKDGKMIEDFNGENNLKTLTIALVRVESVGMYQCFVENQMEAKQASAQITLSGRKQLKTSKRMEEFQNGSFAITSVYKKSDDGKYKCKAENEQGLTSIGTGYLKVIAWLFNALPLPHSLDLTIADAGFSSTLTNVDVNRHHSGNYSCQAKNKAGTVSDQTSVKIKDSPTWNKKPKATYMLSLSTNIEIPCSWKWISNAKFLLVKGYRVEIKYDVNSTDSTSTLIIKNVRIKDSGFYICKAQKSKISNSTRFYLSVEGSDEEFKQGTYSNRSKDGKEHVEYKQNQNFTSSSVKDNFQLYGVAMLYIIPTVTAAIVLLVILIIVCFLLHGQQKKRKKSRNQEMEMRKSWKDQEKDLNGYEYRTSDKRSSLPKSSETYYEIAPNKRISEDQYQFYSQMSSSTCNPDSSSITPYATFRSCTDPVPPIPSCTYPSIYCDISGTGPVFILEPQHSLTFLNHKGAIINCLVHGDPDPIITWVESNGNKQEKIPGYLKILRNNSLVFLPFITGNYRQEIHANSFRCKATNRFGTVVSNLVNVKALVDQHYSTQVYDEYIIEGNTAVFKCHIPSYVKDFVEVNAWIRDDHLRITKLFKKDSRYYITGNGNLHVTNVKANPDSNSIYKCETKHKISGKTTISDHGAELHITELSGSIPPKIIDIAASIGVSAGKSAILPCVSQSNPSPSYRKEQETNCKKIDVSKRKDWTSINEGSLLIVAQKNDSGTYICSASNEMGKEDAVTKVTVFSIPPKLTKTFKSLRLKPGETLNLHCSASGDPLPTILWKVRDLIVQESGVTRIQSDQINGEITSTLSISGITSSNGGFYKCEAVNKISKVFHTELIQVYGPPKVWPISNITVVDGGRKQLTSSKKMNKFKNGSLAIISVNKQSDEGKYKCKAENEHGLTSIGAGYLRVIEKPVIIPLLRSIVIKAGGRLYLHCSVSEGDPPIKFNWLFNGLPLPHSLDLTIADAGFSSILTSVNVNRAHSGNYSCHAKNKAGTVYDQTNVKIKDSPFWNKKPKATYIMSVSTKIEIPCSGNGYPNPKSYWSKIIGEDILELKETERMKVTDVGSLIIHKITHADFENTLVCSVSNGISPDLQQQVQFSKQNAINFINLQNNFSSKQFERVTMKCQVQTNGPVSIRWKHGSKMLSSSLKSRFMIQSGENSTGKISTLMINRVKLEDSGFYICIAQKEEIEMRKSWRDQEKDINSYEYRPGDKRSSLSKSSETYYEIQPNKRFSEDQYQFYSQMSSTTNPEVFVLYLFTDSSSITPYATFRSCTDPVPPIPSSIYCNTSGTGPVFILEPPHTLTFLNHKGAIINCLVHGDPDPIVTWVENNGNKQENIPGYLEILRNNSLVFLPFNTGNYRQEIHASNFRCKATNRFGTIVSNIIKVKALVDQHYSTQVYDEYIIEGNTAVFKCHIPSYVKDFVEVNAWIRDDQLRITKIFKKDSRYYITDNGNLHVTSVKSKQDSNSMYKCETKHKISGKTTISDHGAELHITELSGSIPPKIIDISASISVSAGKTAILPCVSQSNPSPSYSWCLRNEDDSSCKEIDLSKRRDWTSINEGSLMIVARKNDSGTYICSASNEMGKEDAVTKITVFSPISVFIHPQNQMVDIGGSISIECVVSGGPVKSMQWFKDGNIMKNYNRENILKTLTIDPIKVESVGMYQCFVENQMEAKQASAQITLSAIPPKITKTFKSLKLKPGEALTLHCSASGDPLPSILWKIRDSTVEESGMTHIQSEEINGEITSTLSISRITSSDGGFYKCEAVNKISKAFHTQLIQVYGPPKVWPISNRTVIKGDRVVLHCHVSGYPIKEISWFKGRKQLKTSKRMKIFQNGSLGIISVNKESDEGKYKCKAENEHGFNSIGTGYLRVIDKPVIMPLSPSAVFKSGGRLNLHCFVSEGDPPIKFSWLLNGLTLPHSLDLTIANTGFSSTLTGINVNRAHFGNYSCHAKNKAGTVSDQTSVKIKDSPIWSQKPKATYVLSLSSNIEVPCSGNGYPMPKSFWTKVIGEDILEVTETERIRVTDAGSLIINKITQEDFGDTLVCSVTNGINPDLQQHVQFSKQNANKFINLQNNFSSKQFERVAMKCQVQTNGPVTISWKYGSKLLSSSTNSRYVIQSDEKSTGKILTLIINRVRLKDSGFYICIAEKEGISNSTRFYLSVNGIKDDIKQEVSSNRSKGAKGQFENSQTHNFTSSSENDHFQLYGVALLYIIPTVTAAIVLCVILIIVCILLHGQQRKRRKSRNQEIEMRKSWKDHEKDLNSYDYRTSDKRTSLSKSSETYYELRPNKHLSDDQYNFYSQMSSANYNTGN